MKYKRWKPRSIDAFWIFTADGFVTSMQTVRGAKGYWEFGNCFKSREEAEYARDYISEGLEGIQNSISLGGKK